MVQYDEIEYRNLCSKFHRELNRVSVYKSPNRPLTKDIDKRVEYKEALVETFNDIIAFFEPVLQITLSTEEEQDIGTLVTEHLTKLKDSFVTLKLEYTFSDNIYEFIDIDKIIENWSDLNDKNVASNSKTVSLVDTTKSVQSDISQTDQSKQTKMPQSSADFIALGHRTISDKYDGDPLGLESFLDGVALLKELCEDANKALLVKFLMTRLEGEAREAIEVTPKDSDSIVEQLKKRIKTESSKVVEGRILALRADKGNLTKFSERAEELTEQYRRSLVTEGFSKDKAKEIAVEKTVDLCTKTARSERVQAIIASTKFEEPKEVIAKMIVEINNLKLDKNATASTSRYNNNHNKNSNNRFNKSNNRNFHKNSNNYRNSESSNSQNNNHFRQNNGQGNRNGKQYTSRTFNNSNSHNNNNNGRRNDQPIRYFSGNETIPGNGGQNQEQSQ